MPGWIFSDVYCSPSAPGPLASPTVEVMAKATTEDGTQLDVRARYFGDGSYYGEATVPNIYPAVGYASSWDSEGNPDSHVPQIFGNPHRLDISPDALKENTAKLLRACRHNL